MGQLWLAAGAKFYELPPLESYSGGTETTALNQSVVSTLQHQGFQSTTRKSVNPKNPVYEFTWCSEQTPYRVFSKRFDRPPNPQTDYAAVLVCDDANETCPLVPGAELRLPLTYTDPKAYDGTDLEAKKYLEKSEEIGREMLFVLSQVHAR